ncbi:MAG: bifunctional [glutamine synthetase] adenylyltransferase/[glutamine synthetase]-adenylyl-L-tyrosine phosphorylase, partial [Pseudomonadota bacterium]
YSSDIDLIVFYEAMRVPIAEGAEIQRVMVRVVQHVVKLCQERTEHGYVFRVDLRLRPDPGSTAVAISTDAALQYYEALGQNWERAAYIKARIIAGDDRAGEAFLKELQPFVWRKHMDFVAVRDVHAMKRQTHLHKGHGKIAMEGHNVKLGRGGIREIEFFVQTQQLIAGGRNADLRARATVMMLKRLSSAGWITEDTAETLTGHYGFLRRLEHRIQMRRDEQSHVLPKDPEQFAALGRLMGFNEDQAFRSALATCLESVAAHYARLFEDDQDLGVGEGALVFAGDKDDAETLKTLESLGFQNAVQVSGIVRGWHKGHYRSTRTERARSVLTAMTPHLISAFSETADPDRALFAFDAFLKSLPASIQLFSLLNANPHLLSLIAQVMGSAPRLSSTIARAPHVFDALLEPAFFGSLPSAAMLRDQLSASLSEASDYQDVLDRVRVFTQEQQFLIGTRLLSGTVSTLETQALYTTLADVVVERLFEEVRLELERQHGKIDGGDATVLAMGKLGSCEMTPTSDLDLIVIYDAPNGLTQSDGRRPLPVSQYYTRLTQRFVSALSAPTGKGIAYEVDFRLRPSGKAGPLASPLSAFELYQREQAWTWEHAALTRARPVGGGEVLRSKLADVVRSALTAARDPKKIADDLADMNSRIHEAKPASSIWDIKTAPGGLTDIEFLVQYWQLVLADRNDAILSSHTGQALKNLAQAGLADPDDIAVLSRSYEIYSALLQIVRLCYDGEGDFEEAPEELKTRLCQIAEVPDLVRLKAELMNSQQAVRVIFNRVLGVTGEGSASSPDLVSGATQP